MTHQLTSTSWLAIGHKCRS